MGCLLAVFAGFFPRIALVCLWIFTDDVDRAYDSFILPLLGLFFLPLTTLIYALVWAPGGTAHQKAQWLPGFATGELLPTIAVTEPESGGHVLAMSSTAVRDGGSYVLNGRNCFVGNSHIGDVHGVVVRTGPGSRGLTAFLVAVLIQRPDRI